MRRDSQYLDITVDTACSDDLISACAGGWPRHQIANLYALSFFGPSDVPMSKSNEMRKSREVSSWRVLSERRFSALS
jgi:hypothetical protein